MNTVAAASSELPPTTIASTSIGTVAFVNSVPLKLTSGAQTPAMTRIPSGDGKHRGNCQQDGEHATDSFVFHDLSPSSRGCYLHPALPLPGANLSHCSNVECNAWTLRRHHKSGLHSHRAITHDRRRSRRVTNGGLHLCASRLEARDAVSQTCVQIAGSHVSAKQESRNKTYPIR